MRGTSGVNRLLTLLLFLSLVAVCAYWALQIVAPRPAIAPSGSIGDSTAALNLTPSTLLFGSTTDAPAAAPAAISNIVVSGVAEAGPNGVVILSVDGKPAAAYSVGERVTEGTTVKTVGLDRITLIQRGKAIELKTPDRSTVSILSSGNGKSGSSTSAAATASPVATQPFTSAAPVPGPTAPALSLPQNGTETVSLPQSVPSTPPPAGAEASATQPSATGQSPQTGPSGAEAQAAGSVVQPAFPIPARIPGQPSGGQNRPPGQPAAVSQ